MSSICVVSQTLLGGRSLTQATLVLSFIEPVLWIHRGKGLPGQAIGYTGHPLPFCLPQICLCPPQNWQTQQSLTIQSVLFVAYLRTMTTTAIAPAIQTHLIQAPAAKISPDPRRPRSAETNINGIPTNHFYDTEPVPIPRFNRDKQLTARSQSASTRGSGIRPWTYHEISRPLARAYSAAGFDATLPLNIRPATKGNSIPIPETSPRRSSVHPMSSPASDRSTQMRRESFADKVKLEETLSISPAPDKIAWKRIDSPVQRSRWSPDNSDTEDLHDELQDELVEMSTVRRVSRADISTLPQFSRATRIGPVPGNEQARRASLAHFSRDASIFKKANLVSKLTKSDLQEIVEHETTNTLPVVTKLEKGSQKTVQPVAQQCSPSPSKGSANSTEQSANTPSDLLQLVTSMQLTQLEETRRLNGVIASLTQRLCKIESELNTAKQQTVLSPPMTPMTPVKQIQQVGQVGQVQAQSTSTAVYSTDAPGWVGASYKLGSVSEFGQRKVSDASPRNSLAPSPFE